MDINILDVLLQVGLFISALVIYWIFFQMPKHKRQGAGWNFPKYIAARIAVKFWKAKLRFESLCDTPKSNEAEGVSSISFKTTQDGNAFVLGIRKVCGGQSLAEVFVYITLQDGTSYKIPHDSGTMVCSWEDYPNGWSAGGLKVQVLDKHDRFRILYNGLLRNDGAAQHVKLNLIWASASKITRYPEDWSNELAAEVLATEPWLNGDWYSLLDKCCEGTSNWYQTGALQGRLQVYAADGKLDKSEYFKTRGIKENSYLQTYAGLRRHVKISVAAKDGTVVNLQGLTYKNKFTQCVSGSVRMPDFTVQNITASDLVMSEFCTTPDELPNTYTVHINTGKRSLKLVMRMSKDGNRSLSGKYQEYEILHRVIFAEINGECGSGVLELGYERHEKLQLPLSKLSCKLKWLDTKTIKEPIKYCVEFENSAAACVDIVGGKGASLALLSLVQKEEGFQVPPGFCITIKALEKYLEENPDIKHGIKEIEETDVNDQAKFKDKCKRTTEMFLSKELSGELKEDVLQSLKELRIKSLKQNLISEPRFAVRSSAVGEDSEALSAAGQNETVLGVSSDDDVLRAVVKCWASMFAFTSVYYRRQNGQPCLCGGSVVVQVLVEARVAGVMFTRHPEMGDPSRILITANYGLGESVVSGAVEPDTFIVKRHLDDTLSIANVQLGSKSQRIVSHGVGVESEDVSESERNATCLSDEEVLKLAEVGVRQDELWGAGRDIEFAIGNDGSIYLLQARPITSLESWSEEELLHELDFPVMSDDELITFANVGEVLPKPFTALSYDMVKMSLEKGILQLIPNNGDGYDTTIISTHSRCALALYNSIYRRVPKTIDVNLRMLEISIHGHKVADDSILNTALHRREPKATDKLFAIIDMIKNLNLAKKRMTETIKEVTEMNINVENNDVYEMCKTITDLDKVIVKYFKNHATTSVASTATQFIAMSVLLEGKSDFSPEQCNEISVMLNSGDALSAEVPHALGKLALMLEESGKIEEFRKKDPMDASKWLEMNLPEVYKQVMKFLEEHGHRAIMEFDLSTKPWALMPEDLMKVLMHIVPNKDTKQIKSKEDVIASLKTPQKPNTRKVLGWILPFCQRTVCYRESTKAHLILAIHKVRLAAIQLGHLMVKNWYLPRHDLVFFFRAQELKDFIQTRDPALLKKAIQRQNLYPKWCKLKFAELNKGWVEPLPERAPRVSSDGDAKVAGTSVCGGEVIARACVVGDLSEIDQLRQGDILITHATDIGWSPYFPLLAGIVTELGGLISHGAVIAREYGLPCIVGAVDATNVFRTGDMVRLSGYTGILEKVCVEES